MQDANRRTTTMKIYNSLGPNPRALRIVLLEKGLSFPMVTIDILAAENRQGEYLARNPGAQMPSIELDDGTMISETVPIFEYIEDKYPTPPLIGSTPEEKAMCRMWLRRVELKIVEHVYCAFRYGPGAEMYRARQPVFPEMFEGLTGQVQVGIDWLEPLVAGKDHLCGDRFTVADIVLYCGLDFGLGVQIPEALPRNLGAWFERVKARPSVSESLDAAGTKAGYRGV
jgi:glutathione S-transferase